MLIDRKLNKKAFTVVELMVATAIFMLFIGAVFSLYRMGSRMYVSGSWKYMRQKEAERFFIMMKERVEQAANIISIDPKLTDKQVSTQKTKFVSLTNNKNICVPVDSSSKPTKQWIAEFIVAKPDMTAFPSKKKGIVLYHSILLNPNEESGLYDLNMRVEKTADNANFFKTIGNDFPTDFGALKIDNFKAEPSLYGLSPVPHTFELHDVASITVSWSFAASSSTNLNGVEKSPIFGIDVQMRNPKHDQTILEMGCKARIDSSVEYVERASL